MLTNAVLRGSDVLPEERARDVDAASRNRRGATLLTYADVC